MNNKKILVVDDHAEIREVSRILLESEGFLVEEAQNGEEAILKATDDIDLIILDIMMPNKNGYMACKEIREKTNVPILFLTAKSKESDKSMGFSVGGDDYLSKPFSYTELLLRVKSLLRRYYVYKGADNNKEEENIIYINNIEINLENKEVKKNGEDIILTDLEYKIILLMAQNRNKIFSAENLYESIWEEPYYYGANNTIMVHIRKLRKKIEEDPQNPKIIKTVWGRGYRIE